MGEAIIHSSKPRKNSENFGAREYLARNGNSRSDRNPSTERERSIPKFAYGLSKRRRIMEDKISQYMAQGMGLQHCILSQADTTKAPKKMCSKNTKNHRTDLRRLHLDQRRNNRTLWETLFTRERGGI